ncbi:hypothetical protein COY93_02230 [Candidatus Uhrbacteria bacterium CG_4_10_14_0_8_um_filter_58_22]|uniref:Uncharacterized protein n=1 Tax=Candidatus Uhrbacteria bacterium CG_4_10_14_0_8_um_filter_58_22 TaxID=1975029 RepID=A0A2M7QBH2_9BACT|nr:MAG: hypothetical protein AUJ19_01195 [Parcubacteria group bacterium CG1_02_58_44]PIY62792.1 MAG: hypothetical protein COY93_02230 [Candidatus Uhrbacteria bacterium CG_4_10_14_0_8_um_filter_58_22]
MSEKQERPPLDPEAEGQNRIEHAIKTASGIADEILENAKTRGIQDWKREEIERRPTNRDEMFSLEPYLTMVLVERLSSEIAERFGKEEFCDLARWLAQNEMDGVLVENVENIRSGKDVDENLQFLEDARAFSAKRQFDLKGGEYYSGDGYTRDQILVAVKAAVGRLEKATVIQQIASRCLTNGSAVRTGATRKILDMFLAV